MSLLRHGVDDVAMNIDTVDFRIDALQYPNGVNKNAPASTAAPVQLEARATPAAAADNGVVPKAVSMAPNVSQPTRLDAIALPSLTEGVSPNRIFEHKSAARLTKSLARHLFMSVASSDHAQVQTASDKPPDFVVKLYAMFSVRRTFPKPCFIYLIQELGPDLIRWNSGKICIPGPSNRLAAVLPKYFRHGKFTSFQRQLNNVSKIFAQTAALTPRGAQFGFHKKISESSSKLRVYSREDMLGYPAEALLDLRRTPEKGCASWRRGANGPSVAREQSSDQNTPTLLAAGSSSAASGESDSDPSDTACQIKLKADSPSTPACTARLTRVVSSSSLVTAGGNATVVPRASSGDAASTISDDDAAAKQMAEQKTSNDGSKARADDSPAADGLDGSLPGFSDDDCIDAFLDFLDKQVCGNILSNDAVDLFKSPDLGFELTFPELNSPADSFASLGAASQPTPCI